MVFLHIFFTDGGYFNWSLVSVLISMVALIWTIKSDHKNYKANLVKRTQIEWLDQLRTALVSFIDDVPTYVFLYLDTIKETGSETRQANIRLLAQKLNQIRNSYYMVQTFLIDTDSASEKIRQDCGNLWQELISFKRYLDDHPISPAGNVDIENKIANEVAELEQKAIKDSKDYFIAEWAKIRKSN